MIGGADLMGELLAEAEKEAAALRDHYNESLRPHLHRILTDAAVVEVRRTTGEDVTTAEIAIKASLANLALEQQVVLQKRARDIAFRAALILIGRLVPPV